MPHQKYLYITLDYRSAPDLDALGGALDAAVQQAWHDPPLPLERDPPDSLVRFDATPPPPPHAMRDALRELEVEPIRPLSRRHRVAISPYTAVPLAIEKIIYTDVDGEDIGRLPRIQIERPAGFVWDLHLEVSRSMFRPQEPTLRARELEVGFLKYQDEVDWDDPAFLAQTRQEFTYWKDEGRPVAAPVGLSLARILQAARSTDPPPYSSLRVSDTVTLPFTFDHIPPSASPEHLRDALFEHLRAYWPYLR